MVALILKPAEWSEPLVNYAGITTTSFTVFNVEYSVQSDRFARHCVYKSVCGEEPTLVSIYDGLEKAKQAALDEALEDIRCDLRDQFVEEVTVSPIQLIYCFNSGSRPFKLAHVQVQDLTKWLRVLINQLLRLWRACGNTKSQNV